MCDFWSDERESVRRTNFGEGSGKEWWERHERHVKIAWSSAKTMDVGFFDRWEVMEPWIETLFLTFIIVLPKTTRTEDNYAVRIKNKNIWISEKRKRVWLKITAGQLKLNLVKPVWALNSIRCSPKSHPLFQDGGALQIPVILKREITN